MSGSYAGNSSCDSSADRSCADLANCLQSSGGVPMVRVSKSHKLKNVSVSLLSRGDGLQYQPGSGKASLLFFTNVVAVRSLPSSDPIYHKANLRHFQYCFQVESQFGWSWYLICNTELERRTWVDFLEQRRRVLLAESRTSVADVNVTHFWAAAALRGKTKLSFNEVSALFKTLFGHIPAEEFAKQFRLSDTDNDTYLDFEEFRSLFSYFNEVDFVRQLYEKQTADVERGMTAEEFTRFCTENGSSNNGSGAAASSISPIRCATLFQLFTNRQADALNLGVFTAFLLHPHHNSAVDPRHVRVVDSMDFPLNQYYINSSHNTYLTGNQLNSASSCNMYRDVLQAGCRCVEIDCWDGADGQPVVYHGHTMTTKINFDDVIRTIDAYAFLAPETTSSGSGSFGSSGGNSSAWNPREFPVILSLEVHTNTEQTNRLAVVMQTIFQDRLFKPTQDPSSYTPAKLKNKILVKWKMNAAGVEEVKDTTGSGIRPDRRAVASHSLSTTFALSSCAAIGSVKTSTWGADEQPYHVESYSEAETARLGNVASSQFICQNSRMLSRTYPAGTRIDSSNYDPMPMWRLGCQIVALNWQSRDQNLRVNEGFFHYQNGGCGYVLKPTHLRDVGAGVQTSPFKLFLRLICGSHLHTTFDRVEAADVWVRVWVHGDMAAVETTAVRAATMCPQWNESVKLRGDYRGTDVVCFRVMARSSSGNTYDVCGSCLPVCVLRSGLHAIPLRHVKGRHVAELASVFCHIRFEDSHA